MNDRFALLLGLLFLLWTSFAAHSLAISCYNCENDNQNLFHNH